MRTTHYKLKKKSKNVPSTSEFIHFQASGIIFKAMIKIIDACSYTDKKCGKSQ